MNDTIKILFGLFGGLAIFIFGMNMMSECLQKVAGDKMKKILSMLTSEPESSKEKFDNLNPIVFCFYC